jgi:hypothetical protein
LKLCFQKITDTLRKYQQRSPLTIIILKSLFRRGRGLRALRAGGTGSGGQGSGRTKR